MIMSLKALVLYFTAIYLKYVYSYSQLSIIRGNGGAQCKFFAEHHPLGGQGGKRAMVNPQTG
jgi:hypothetical protein